MATRSLQLRHSVAPASSVAPVYTVGSLHTLIVKHMAFTNPAATTNYVNVMVVGSGPQVIAVNVQIAAGSTTQVWPWLVLEPGQRLELNTGPAGSVHYVISGALLEGTAE